MMNQSPPASVPESPLELDDMETPTTEVSERTKEGSSLLSEINTQLEDSEKKLKAMCQIANLHLQRKVRESLRKATPMKKPGGTPPVNGQER
jgi:hypothetical protein